ncbi:DNA polymerase III subunit gamma and tau [Nocardia sp. NPDC049149]|uniref:DNA polymerase III subunit gamma and tau n=1 Tax=Nocardia sp. NPDC049149 TaxID=3364315 RepID=UPI003710999D
MALYRKYRPATFAEVVGQEHVTDPLSTALDTGRISHAYLFSGPRGCGKTSSARILARSLNCVDGPTSTPCGVCPSCVALGPGGTGNLDVTELDAASHGGVDDTRELRDRAFYAPAESRYRVFIVDEAHMVTTAGFNALLKIVEEPPAHLIFIFATTEPDKVLPTIRSRTHHYPFRLLPPATMRGLLGKICEQEQVPVDEAVYPLVIRAGGGSPRDSLSVLDQLLAGAGPEGVTYPRAVSLLGVTDVALIDDAIEALAADDGAALFGTVDRVMEAGHDPRRFAVDLLERLRDLILMRAVPDAVERALVSGPGDVLDRMRDQAERLGPATLTRYAELLHEALGEMRGATSPRLLLEVVCARMLLPSVSDAESATLQRLERLERGFAGGAVQAPAPSGAAPAASPAAATPRPAAAPPAEPNRRRGAEALAAIRRETAGPTAAASNDAAAPHPAADSADTAGAGAAPGTPGQAAAPAAGRSAAPGGSSDQQGESEPAGSPNAAASAQGAPAAGQVPAGSGEQASSAGAPEQEVAQAVSPDESVDRPVAEPAQAFAFSPQPTVAASPDADASPDAAPAEPAGEDRDPAAAPVAAQADSAGEASPAPQQHAAATPVPAAAQPEPAAAPAGASTDLLREVEAAWGDIRAKVREFGAAVQAMLAGASVARIEGDVIVFAHQHAPLAQRLSDPRNLEAVRSAVRAVLGRDHDVRWEAGGAAQRPAAAPRAGGQGNRQRGAEQQSGRESGNAGGRSADAPAPPRFSRPSQAKKAAGDEAPGAGKARAGGAEPRSFGGDDDIPPPDFPDLPDDPGPFDAAPPESAQPAVGKEADNGSGWAADRAVPETTPEDEEEMIRAAAVPVAPEDRRDPDEVALELLKSELGATRLSG